VSIERWPVTSRSSVSAGVYKLRVVPVLPMESNAAEFSLDLSLEAHGVCTSEAVFLVLFRKDTLSPCLYMYVYIHVYIFEYVTHLQEI
jgi:hypothetical protein